MLVRRANGAFYVGSGLLSSFYWSEVDNVA